MAPSLSMVQFLCSSIMVLILCAPVHSSTCIGQNGDPVDWFILYKLPGNCASPTWVRGNVSLYMDSSTLQQGRTSGCDLTCTTCPTCPHTYPCPLRTHTTTDIPWQPASIDAAYPLNALLEQLITNNTSLILYNDQPPWFDGQAKPSYTRFLAYAHAKGVLHWNNTNGFWLQHTVPQWPNITDQSNSWWKYIATPQTCNGQHFLCMSLTTKVINSTAGALLNTIRPTMYQVPPCPV